MSRNALVTGGSGFVGQWLAHALLEDGWRVVALGLHEPPAGVLTPAERSSVEWLHGDIRDGDMVHRAVDRSAPDAIFHLAGISFIPTARDAPAATFEVNVLGAVRVLSEAAQRRRAGVLDPAVLVVGSATQYGPHAPADMPLVETAEQRPADVYAASKAAQEIAALQAHRAEELRVICTRSFNHSGAGHPEHFLLPALVRRALALEGSQPRELRVGNQDSVRDYLHVADVVQAYLLLVRNGQPGEVYNVCSGLGVNVRQLAEEVLLHVGITAEITTDPAFVRGVDVPLLVGSPAKLRTATGWRPTRTRADIIHDLIHAATH